MNSLVINFMKHYTLTSFQNFELGLDEVFEFFSRPENLERITPRDLNFKIITPSPINMEEGQEIDYKISISGFPVKWKTLITKYDPPNFFIDSQIKGPYSMWIHSHSFTFNNGVTTVKDVVKYLPPLHIIGGIANRLYIRRMLIKIFTFRFYAISDIFNDRFPSSIVQNDKPKIEIV